MTPGVHYEPRETATYSSDRDSVRAVMSIASQDGYELFHVDIKSAFLHEAFKGKAALYLQPLPSFDGYSQRTDYVNMLTANLYGTTQACQVYITSAYDHLRKHGYRQVLSDNSVFMKETDRGFIIMALTVDEFLVAASTQEIYNDLLDTRKLKYKVKDLGLATRILNWTITRPTPGKHHYHVSQQHKTQVFIDILGMSRSHPMKTPQAPGHPLTARRPDEPPVATSPTASVRGCTRSLTLYRRLHPSRSCRHCLYYWLTGMTYQGPCLAPLASNAIRCTLSQAFQASWSSVPQ